MKKKEICIFSGILLLAVLLWLSMTALRRSKDYGEIRITVGGTEYGIYSLKEDQKISIGTTNVCVIQNGTAKMTEANCPDHLCMKQPAVDLRGGLIICLPNQVVIEGISSDPAAGGHNILDAVSR
ncbi:MAG: NusG domain II-containing protein [Lachnospiraceae bacterium]|nr:NusG domain II-containing protein [Lachnospiraceae bacterium]